MVDLGLLHPQLDQPRATASLRISEQNWAGLTIRAFWPHFADSRRGRYDDSERGFAGA